MAKTCRLNRDTVWRALSELEESGWVKRRQRPGDSNAWTLIERPSGKEGVAEKEGCHLNSAVDSGKEGVPGGGKGGVAPSGKEVVRRVSTEGYPQKGIQEGAVRPPQLSPIPDWHELSEIERQQIADHAGSIAGAEAAFSVSRDRKLNFKDNVSSTASMVSMVIADIKRAMAPAKGPRLTKVVLGSPTCPVEVNLAEKWQGKLRYRVMGDHVVGLPEVIDDKLE
jgi:hypothetical protein